MLDVGTSKKQKRKGKMTTVNITQDHDTCLALEQVVMLPQDVVDLAAEDEKIVANLFVMQHVQVSSRASIHLLIFSVVSFEVCIACL